jgi:hypothetical protein
MSQPGVKLNAINQSFRPAIEQNIPSIRQCPGRCPAKQVHLGNHASYYAPISHPRRRWRACSLGALRWAMPDTETPCPMRLLSETVQVSFYTMVHHSEVTSSSNRASRQRPVAKSIMPKDIRYDPGSMREVPST